MSTWTREAIEALGPVTDVPTTASVLGCSDWTVYEQIRRGEWHLTRVLRLGRKIKIPTHDLIALLYGAPPESSEAAPGRAARANDVPDKDNERDQYAPATALRTVPRTG